MADEEKNQPEASEEVAEDEAGASDEVAEDRLSLPNRRGRPAGDEPRLGLATKSRGDYG